MLKKNIKYVKYGSGESMIAKLFCLICRQVFVAQIPKFFDEFHGDTVIPEFDGLIQSDVFVSNGLNALYKFRVHPMIPQFYGMIEGESDTPSFLKLWMKSGFTP
jgi:hypothetical protein